MRAQMPPATRDPGMVDVVGADTPGADGTESITKHTDMADPWGSSTLDQGPGIGITGVATIPHRLTLQEDTANDFTVTRTTTGVRYNDEAAAEAHTGPRLARPASSITQDRHICSTRSSAGKTRTGTTAIHGVLHISVRPLPSYSGTTSLPCFGLNCCDCGPREICFRSI